jgi:hypothetical protein
MTASGYLVVAYAVFWGLTFVLVFSIRVRQRRLERDLAALAAMLGPEGADAGPETASFKSEGHVAQADS